MICDKPSGKWRILGAGETVSSSGIDWRLGLHDGGGGGLLRAIDRSHIFVPADRPCGDRPTHGHEALVRGYDKLGLGGIHEIFRFIDENDIVAEAELILLEKAVRAFTEIKGHEATRLLFNLNPHRLSTVAGLVPEMSEILAAMEWTSPGLLRAVGVRDLPSEEETAWAINLFREGGLRIALDDFGQGYSRLPCTSMRSTM